MNDSNRPKTIWERSRLDPAVNVSQLLDGTWVPHHQPDQEKMLEAAQLSWAAKKITRAVRNSCITFRVLDGGVQFISEKWKLVAP